jgi:hypothetical protein
MADVFLIGRVAGGVLLALLSTSFAYEVILRPHDAFNLQYVRFSRPNVTPEIVFVGDSRVLHGLHHASMGTAFFNYAHFGEYPFAQVLRARHVLRDKPGVKVIVLQLDSYVAVERRAYQALPQTRAFYDSLLFAPLQDVEMVVHPTSSDLLRNFAAFYYPLWLWWERIDFWGAIRQIATRVGLDTAAPPARHLNACADLVNTAPSGWANMSADERVKSGMAEAMNRYRGVSLSPENERLFRDFIVDATARGIRVLGLRTPEAKEFRSASSTLIDPAAERIAETLGVELLDYREAFLDHPELFTDAEHLTDAGAVIWSGRVAHHIGRILGKDVGPAWSCPAEPLTASIHLWPYEIPARQIRRMIGL